MLEQITAGAFPDYFNASNDANEDDGLPAIDDRSDNKGPEPEAVTIARYKGEFYAFIGLERVGGIMIYNVTDPTNARFVDYVNNRDFTGDAEAGTAGDLGPEEFEFVPWHKSPTGQPLLLVANEVSGTTTVFELQGLDFSEATVPADALELADIDEWVRSGAATNDASQADRE